LALGVRGTLLAKIFVSKVQDVRGGWRAFLYGERHDAYSSSYLRRVRWARHVARMEEKKMILVGKPEKNGQLGSCSRRWKENIKMYVNKCYSRECIGLNWLMIGTGGGSLCMLVGSWLVS